MRVSARTPRVDEGRAMFVCLSKALTRASNFLLLRREMRTWVWLRTACCSTESGPWEISCSSSWRSCASSSSDLGRCANWLRGRQRRVRCAVQAAAADLMVQVEDAAAESRFLSVQPHGSHKAKGQGRRGEGVCDADECSQEAPDIPRRLSPPVHSQGSAQLPHRRTASQSTHTDRHRHLPP